jgi:hypothetical protein
MACRILVYKRNVSSNTRLQEKLSSTSLQEKRLLESFTMERAPQILVYGRKGLLEPFFYKRNGGFAAASRQRSFMASQLRGASRLHSFARFRSAAKLWRCQDVALQSRGTAARGSSHRKTQEERLLD